MGKEPCDLIAEATTFLMVSVHKRLHVYIKRFYSPVQRRSWVEACGGGGDRGGGVVTILPQRGVHLIALCPVFT